MPEISQITLPSGEAYMLKDATARASIPTKLSDLESDISFLDAEFSGTTLVLGTASTSTPSAEGVGF